MVATRELTVSVKMSKADALPIELAWQQYKAVKTIPTFQMELDMWMMEERYLTMIMKMNHQLVSKSISFLYIVS